MMAPTYIAGRLSVAYAGVLALPWAPTARGLAMPRLVEAHRQASGGRILPTPSAQEIDRMHYALNWLTLMERDSTVLRRVLELRALSCPVTRRPRYSWKKIGTLLRCDPRAAQKWHLDALEHLARRIDESGSRKLAA
jgi:hypothetical protein